MASQLENPKLKEEKYTDDIYGSYVRWPMAVRSHPFPHSEDGVVGSAASPEDPSSAREGLSFPPHVQSVGFFSLLGRVPHSACSYLRKPKSTGLRRRLSP